MNKAYYKDILRSVQKGWKRFLSIMLITALGVAMLTGLYAACLDMYYSADQFYDEQKLFDIRVLSTLGLTEEDVRALAQVDGVETAEGGYSETVRTDVDGIRKSAEMTVLSPTGLNAPYLLDGALPSKAGEIAVTQKYLDESGKSIGDALTLDEETEKDNGEPGGDWDLEMNLGEEKTSAFANTRFTVVGAVLDPMDIQGSGAKNIFRAAASSDYTFFVAAADASSDIFTAVHLVLDGTREMDSYSDEYEYTVRTVIRQIENRIKAPREQARYDSVMLEARKKLEAAGAPMDAKFAELDKMEMTRWYIQDRTSIDSYSSLTNDLSSIEAVGKVFPVIFLLVAILMSLTAMTRMVEEERGLIGTYKALGYGNGAVYRKYLLFAFMACLLGGILGDLFGFVFMPQFVSIIMEELYSLPHINLRFDLPYGVGGVLLFILGILGATVLACRSELAKMPSALMRPKAPRAGSRVFLERIPAVWSRLKFLNKVTVRNLFRYKKRLFMTVGGIMGCTALILCGFAIKDSIEDLAPKQYENIYQYDLMAVFADEANDDFVRQMSGDSRIDDVLNLRMESVKVINADEDGEKVQLMVIPDESAFNDYIHIENLKGKRVAPGEDGILITRNAARILGLKPGGSVSLQDMGLVERETVVSDVVQNYLGNNVYMTQNLYEQLFGKYAPNGVLAHLSVDETEQAAYAEALLRNDSVLSAVSTAALRADFGFDLINAVVLLITVMAGGLAFVVLFTLSNTNISERVRELATIKVLGFYDKEVHQYVNKESLILTLIGILIGLPVGRVLSGFLTTALNMPAMYFAVHIEPVSYLISAMITFCFAVVVNWMTNRTLNRINMVEALKSVE